MVDAGVDEVDVMVETFQIFDALRPRLLSQHKQRQSVPVLKSFFRQNELISSINALAMKVQYADPGILCVTYGGGTSS